MACSASSGKSSGWWQEELKGYLGDLVRYVGRVEGRSVWADMKDRLFWKGEEMSPGDCGQKSASSKCGGFFFLDPDIDMSLLELKHSFLT